VQVHYGLHLSCMTKTKIEHFEYIDISDIKICFYSLVYDNYDFLAKNEEIVEEAAEDFMSCYFINYNLMTVDMIFLNIN